MKMKNKELEKIFKEAASITDEEIRTLYLKKHLKGRDLSDSDIDDLENAMDYELSELEKDVDEYIKEKPEK
jgi:uncharacterized protein YneF (UPF0154 family)